MKLLARNRELTPAVQFLTFGLGFKFAATAFRFLLHYLDLTG